MSESTYIPLLQADQRERWQRGDRASVEMYLAQRPALQADPDGLLDLIYHEMLLREESGETPRLPEYLERFPQFAAELRRLFEVHQVVESTSFDDGAPPTQIAPDTDPPSKAVARPGPLAGYEVLAELGRGGMGVVYRARDPRLNRLVALKMILAGAHAGARDLARLRGEAEAIARLQHPNITQIYAFEEQDGQPFLALELVDGVSLHQHLGRQPLPIARAATLAETLARAVHYAHQRGVVHRDLKPSNVLIAADGTAKITDFGLAKLLDNQEGATASEALIGTPNYMAPEQARGRGRDIGPAADIYSLGAILYELLTGRPPFRGSTVLETLDQVRTQEPRAPHRLRPGVPRDLETICLKCLDKDPARRYRNAEELADDLRRFLNHEPIAAQPTPWWRRVGKWVRRRPAAAVAVAAIVTFVIGLPTAFAWSQVQEAARVARVRDGVQEADRLGRIAVARQDWPLAKAQFATALNQIDAEPALAELRDGIADLHEQTSRRLAEDAERRRLDSIYRAFLRARDDALFHGLAAPPALAKGMAPAALRGAADNAARRALSLVGFDPDSTAPWQPDVGFTAAQRVEIAAGCHAALQLLGRTPSADRARGLQASAAQQDFLTGHRHYRQGELAQAVRAFDRALAAQPDLFWAHCGLALCAMQRQHWQEARLRLDLCLGKRPDVVWARLLRGLVASRCGEQEAAARNFQEAERLLKQESNPGASYVLLLYRADLAQRQGDLAAAAASLRQAVALQPEQFTAHLVLAAVCARLDRVEATEHLQRALALEPPAPALAEFHARRGRDLYEAKRYPEAIAACTRALAQQADSAFALGVLGHSLLELRRFAEAAKAFDRYLAAGGPETLDAYRGRGQSRMQLGDHLGAVDDYTRVVEQAPSSEIHMHRGWAYFFADAFRPALRDFDTALNLDAANGNAYTGRALAHVMLGNVQAAVADAETALKRKPATPDMMQNLACVFALAAVKVDTDSAVPERGKLAAGYRARAMKLVAATLDLVPPPERARIWRTQVLPDTALDSLRALPEFKQLARQYGSN